MHDHLTTAVITVGKGRGFVIEGDGDRLVITAAHCLPFLPPCHGSPKIVERTYQGLLAEIGSRPTVWAECLFCDPISDIAVLGPPDIELFGEQSVAYEVFSKDRPTLPLSDAPRNAHAWLLSLDGRWFSCDARHRGGPLWISNATAGIRGGMSGSPILTDDESAVGVVCIGAGTEEAHYTGGPNPRIAYHLPKWALRRCGLLPALS